MTRSTTTKKVETSLNKPSKSLGIKTRVLFVCMGNICRSPMAKAVF
ncbi:MAG: hypothetical protein O2844_08820, partial [Proteobacteria bacterium]|nr:hypothetical protein [Pseudomonadota bacterium]